MPSNPPVPSISVSSLADGTCTGWPAPLASPARAFLCPSIGTASETADVKSAGGTLPCPVAARAFVSAPASTAAVVAFRLSTVTANIPENVA